ncbi:MAG: hydrolase 1, exosortase A system-associated [Thiobacillus sp.]
MNTPSWREQPVVFECDGDSLIGIIAQPAQPIETGVVIIVGGPQYRAGSHRQFTLLARQLAEQGIASIRFDYRGMGDSEGDMRNFEDIDADIKAAIDTFTTQTPGIKQIVLWGLCDAASAALYYGHTDPRVKGLILLNPWAHTEAGAARARLKHYYLNRLLSKAFWAKLFSGKVRLNESIGDLAKSTQQASADNAGCPAPTSDPRHGSPGYIECMREGMKLFQGNIQIILSGNDLTAKEFIELKKSDKYWKNACSTSNVKYRHIAGANHTFSSHAWRNEVGLATDEWIKANRHEN